MSVRNRMRLVSYRHMWLDDDDVLLRTSHVRCGVLGGIGRVRLIRCFVISRVCRWVWWPVRRHPSCTVYKTSNIDHERTVHTVKCGTFLNNKHPVGTQLAWKCLITPAFRRTILTCKLSHWAYWPIFGVRSWFIYSRSAHAKLQVSCAKRLRLMPRCLTSKHTQIYTQRQTALWPAYMNSSAELKKIKFIHLLKITRFQTATIKNTN